MSDSDISSSLEHCDAIHHMLAALGWGTPMLDEHGDSSLSLAEIHVLRETINILKHNYSYLFVDRDYLMKWGSTYYDALLRERGGGG